VDQVHRVLGRHRPDDRRSGWIGGLDGLVAGQLAAFDTARDLGPRLERVLRHAPLIGIIETFWLDPANRKGAAWREHEDINSVMLATSLTPRGYLGA